MKRHFLVGNGIIYIILLVSTSKMNFFLLLNVSRKIPPCPWALQTPKTGQNDATGPQNRHKSIKLFPKPSEKLFSAGRNSLSCKIDRLCKVLGPFWAFLGHFWPLLASSPLRKLFTFSPHIGELHAKNSFFTISISFGCVLSPLVTDFQVFEFSSVPARTGD